MLARRLLQALVLCGLFALPASAVAQGLGLPGPGGCLEDPLEPNPFTSPTWLTDSLSRDDLNICTSDDWFRVDLLAGQVVRFELRFAHSAGDIDMTLHDADYQLIDISESAANLERLDYVAREPTTLFLRVYGFGGASNEYTFEMTLEDYAPGCESGAGGPLAVDTVTSAAVCLGERAEWTLDVEEGAPLDLTLTSTADLGDLDLALFDEEGRRVATSSSRGAWERVRLFPDDDARIRIVVAGYAGGFGPFSLAAVRLPEDPAPIEVVGAVSYTRRLAGERGLKELAEVTPEGALVEIVRRLDGFPVARTTTDAQGRYAFALDHVDPAGHVLRVSARLEAPGYRFRVVRRNGSDDVHGIDSAPLSEYPVEDGRLTLNLHLPPDDVLTGALNIAQVVRLGFETVMEAAPGAGLDLTFVWDRDQAHPCGSCYSDGQILLAGGPRDTDEFDDAVILHELGHFISDHLSWDDSPGGSHDGSRTNPLIAFGEGYATAFALLVMGAPLYVDSSSSGLRSYEDLDRAPFLAAYGTSDGTLSGDVSEWTTASLLWDLLDDYDEDEPFDRVSRSRLEMLRIILDVVVDHRRPDVGAAGMELADFLNTFRCVFREDAAALEQLVWGHQRYPIDRVGKAKCEWSPHR